MSVPPGSEWQHRADGFSGVDKFCRLLPNNVDRRASVKSRRTSTIDDRIVTGTTPKPKEKCKAVSLAKNKRGISSAAWKPGDFLQDFDVSQDLVAQADDITWSSSSSDECLPLTSDPEIRKRALREPRHRKKKQLSICRSDSPCQPQADGTVSPAASQHLGCHAQSLRRQNTTAVASVGVSEGCSEGQHAPLPGSSLLTSVCVSGGCSESQHAPIDTVLLPGSSLLTSVDVSGGCSERAPIDTVLLPGSSLLTSVCVSGGCSEGQHAPIDTVQLPGSSLLTSVCVSGGCSESQHAPIDTVQLPGSSLLTSVGVSGGCSEGQHAPIDTVLLPGSSLLTSATNVSKVRSDTCANFRYRTREKRSKMSWTMSSFDDIKQMSSPSTGTAAVTASHKLRLSHGSFSRCRFWGSGVQKLWAGESQESFGEISDVESDTEIDTLDIDPGIVGSDIETLSSHTTNVGDWQQPDDSLQSDVQDGEKSSPVEISSGTSSPPSSSHSEKIRASEWIKVLQTHRTPEKADHSVDCQQDSAKKTRKCARGSMAEQLTRLINREKAAVRFWHHSVKSGTFCDSSTRSLLLRLQSLKKQYSLFMAQCHLVDEGGGSKPCRAMFVSETVQTLSLKPGAWVQVFAPWQQLEEDNGMHTFLCTHFVRISPDVNQQLGQIQEDVNITTSTSAFWKCPCSTDAHLPTQACQATLCPVIPLQKAQLKPATDTGCSVRHTTTLHTVAALPDHPSVCPEPKRMLLESLERMRGDSSLLPTFTASVLRVFRHRGKDTWKHRFQLLVEDAAGTLAIVRLADECKDVHEEVYRAEGQTYTLSGLQVVCRTNRDKEPALFRIIDQLWTRQFMDVSSQHSGSDASQTQVHVAAPGFAYVLHSVSPVACMSMDPDAVAKEASVRLITLKEALQAAPGTRVSFVARALLPVGFSQWHREEANQLSTVYVYDASVHLRGNRTAVQRVEVGTECIMENSSTGVYLFRDVSVHQGHLQCDGYTLVLEMAAWNTWSLCRNIDRSMAVAWTVTLPPVCHMSEVSSLVSLEGVVSGVDEDEAYSWEECETCGSDRLATTEEVGAVYCTGCNSQVRLPVTRMKMKVCVTCKDVPLPDLQVQLDLAQATIESLLPSEPDDEGFDTQQVIGKPMKCLACLVLSRVCDPSSDVGIHPKVTLRLVELTQ